ncbi:MAG: hypothetical protein IPP55_20520 [Anaerolineales bacterium]|nr:hypothetical protein [Anaerolineales bacterium]
MHVPELFTIENTPPSSKNDINGQGKDQRHRQRNLRGAFPCSSITGAPKSAP